MLLYKHTAAWGLPWGGGGGCYLLKNEIYRLLYSLIMADKRKGYSPEVARKAIVFSRADAGGGGGGAAGVRPPPAYTTRV